METIAEWIEGTVEANLKSVMAGDDAIPKATAITIAMEAANMGSNAAAKKIAQHKRLDLGCDAASRLLATHDSSSLRISQDDITTACGLGLAIVDTMFQTIAETPPPGSDVPQQ